VKRILVTGARGQLGQDICRTCAARGIDVVAVDLAELDITSKEAVGEGVTRARPEAIINCAAYNAVDDAETELDQALLVNAVGPRHLALAAERAGIPLMHFSSDYVFDGLKTTPYTTADRPNPLSAYGRSKLQGELEVQNLAPKHYVVRLSWVFGAGNDNFVRKVLSWIRDSSKVRVVDDQIACPTYTADVSPMLVDLLGTNTYGLYHLTNQGYCSRYAWARHVASAVGRKATVKATGSGTFKTPATRPAFSALDSSTLVELLGRQMPSWQDATERFLIEMGV